MKNHELFVFISLCDCSYYCILGDFQFSCIAFIFYFNTYNIYIFISFQRISFISRYIKYTFASSEIAECTKLLNGIVLSSEITQVRLLHVILKL
jgi:hypothetical protein